ncbi:MAG: outer membrane protein assembly factor BamE [Hyphomonadaceae bacterium]|nr:outer membrane protein assembly factor BamE [Hyphomonadaceae bacterium]
MERMTLGKVAALALLAGAVSACNPIRDTHGFSAVTEDQKNVEVGVDTKSTVLARLGTPSTQSAFDETAWYYISTVQERYAFYMPRTVGREVLVVKFDADGKVSNVERFGMEKGQVIAYSDDKTPTRGRELGIVEQIFGNIGNTSPIRSEDEDRGPRDRR